MKLFSPFADLLYAAERNTNYNDVWVSTKLKAEKSVQEITEHLS